MFGNRHVTNTERFIHEISTRSCIWNTRCLEYKIKKKRKIAWEEICTIFFANFNSKKSDRKEHLCRLLQKKWKSIRDTYVRDLRKNNRSKYMHAHSLSFLGDSIKFNKPLDANTEIDDNADYYPDPDEGENKDETEAEAEEFDDEEDDEEEMMFRNNSFFCPHDTPQNSNSNHSINLDFQTPVEPKIPSPLPEQSTSAITSKSTTDEDDEDRLFLLSLVKDLKKVPEPNKLEAKSELLLVLNKWKKSKTQLCCAFTL